MKGVGSDEIISYTCDETSEPSALPSVSEPTVPAGEIVDDTMAAVPSPEPPRAAAQEVFKLESETQKPQPKVLGRIELSDEDLKKNRWKR